MRTQINFSGVRVCTSACLRVHMCMQGSVRAQKHRVRAHTSACACMSECMMLYFNDRSGTVINKERKGVHVSKVCCVHVYICIRVCVSLCTCMHMGIANVYRRACMDTRVLMSIEYGVHAWVRAYAFVYGCMRAHSQRSASLRVRASVRACMM